MGWTLLTLKQSRGFINSYTVQYERLSSIGRRKRRQVQTVVVPSSANNALLTDLHPTSLYAIGVFGSNDGGTGVIDQRNTVDSKCICV